jgi:phage gp29-like protein
VLEAVVVRVVAAAADTVPRRLPHTPIEGLWHTSAGANPFGALCGWSGRTTARTILGGTLSSLAASPGHNIANSLLRDSLCKS